MAPLIGNALVLSNNMYPQVDINLTMRAENMNYIEVMIRILRKH